MTLPLTHSDAVVTTPRSMTSPLTIDDTVHDAWERLRGTGETVVVLTRHGHPVALATRDAIEHAMAEGNAEAPVDRVTDFVAVPVDRGSDALDTIHGFTRAAWDWLVYDREGDARRSSRDRWRIAAAHLPAPGPLTAVAADAGLLVVGVGRRARRSERRAIRTEGPG